MQFLYFTNNNYGEGMIRQNGNNNILKNIYNNIIRTVIYLAGWIYLYYSPFLSFLPEEAIDRKDCGPGISDYDKKSA